MDHAAKDAQATKGAHNAKDAKDSKTWTVGRLAARFGLSRSTLLYYDRLGLLRPRGRAPGDYRRYGAGEVARLERILTLRRAGLALADIRRVLEAGSSNLTETLEGRLAELDAEAAEVRRQQELVARLLGAPATAAQTGPMDRASWCALLRASGFDETAMHRWHAAFERSDPEKHQRFLEFLRIPADEINRIRAWSCDPRRVIRIQAMSDKFMKLLFKTFETLPRQGPGERAATLRALAAVPDLPTRPARPRILDVGCGSGASTLVLAAATDGEIWATDVHPPVLATLAERVRTAGCADRVHVVNADMAGLGGQEFAATGFDLVWCEGAIFVLGVDRALEQWRELVRPGGCMAFSELVWLDDGSEAAVAARPESSLGFMAETYPECRTGAELEAAARARGWNCLTRFRLARHCWTEFYGHLALRLDELERELAHDAESLAYLEVFRNEIKVYEENRDSYGYEFLVLQRPK